MFFSDMERKTLAITPPLLLLSSLFFRGASFGSSKAFHCLLLLSCLLLSSVNTLHNLPVASKGFHGFNGGDSKGLESQNVCPVSHFFSFLSSLRLENQFDDPGVSFFGLLSCCPNKSGLISDDLSSVVLLLSPRPVHIIGLGETNCYKSLFKELYGKKNNGELTVSVLGNRCGGNGFMVDHQKLLLFYWTELSWLSGVAVFAVPMKETEPILVMNIWKKPLFWVRRSKKLSVAVLIVAALLILIFCFIDENHKRNVDVGEVEKPSSFTISPEMDSLLRSISKETEVVVESVSSSCQVETSEAMSLSVNTEKDKKRRRNKKKKKKNVSSSNSGNSTPRSPPMTPKPSTTTQAATTTKLVILSQSATFPVSKVIIQGSTLAPNVRAPGKKSRTEMKEENVKEYMYDIWGDHLTGLNLMDRFKEVKEGKTTSGFGEEDECESFFVKGPQSFLADSHAMFVSFYNHWG